MKIEWFVAAFNNEMFGVCAYSHSHQHRHKYGLCCRRYTHRCSSVDVRAFGLFPMEEKTKRNKQMWIMRFCQYYHSLLKFSVQLKHIPCTSVCQSKWKNMKNSIKIRRKNKFENIIRICGSKCWKMISYGRKNSF